MKKLKVPSYGWREVKALKKYARKTKAKDPWGNGTKLTKSFKANVTSLLLIEQSKRCAYCGGRLNERKPHRDHIAPNEKYRKWMFWPENLVLACFACNTELKGTFNPIVKEGKNYRGSIFSIIHPYIDNPADHIGYAADGLSILIKEVNGSQKGAETIRIFNLTDPERAKQRAKDKLHDEDTAHLYGDFKSLFDAAAEQINNMRLKLKMH